MSSRASTVNSWYSYLWVLPLRLSLSRSLGVAEAFYTMRFRNVWTIQLNVVLAWGLFVQCRCPKFSVNHVAMLCSLNWATEVHVPGTYSTDTTGLISFQIQELSCIRMRARRPQARGDTKTLWIHGINIDFTQLDPPPRTMYAGKSTSSALTTDMARLLKIYVSQVNVWYSALVIIACFLRLPCA